MRTTQTTARRRRLAVGVTALVALSLAACGSSEGGDDGADLSASQQECVDAASGHLDDRQLLPERLPKELTPLSKPPTPGLVFTKLAWGAVPTDVESSMLMADFADDIGWVGKTVTWDGSVEDANRKLIEAAETADITYAPGPQPSSIQSAVKASEENDVLLMLSSPEDPTSVPGFGANPIGIDTWKGFGVDAARMIVKETGCQGNVAVFGMPDEILRGAASGVEETLKAECDDCKHSYTEIPQADIGSPAATNAVISKLQSDPSIDFAFFVAGDLAAGIEPALKQAGVDVQVGGILPSAPNLAALKNGDNTFWLGLPQETTALVALDAALRALDSDEPITGPAYPAPIFTQDNVTATDKVPAYPKDIADQFKKLWLVD